MKIVIYIEMSPKTSRFANIYKISRDTNTGALARGQLNLMNAGKSNKKVARGAYEKISILLYKVFEDYKIRLGASNCFIPQAVWTTARNS